MAEVKVYTVDDYKTYLGYGQKANLYKVDLIFPAAITNIDAEKVFSIMCDTCTMPGERPMAVTSVPYEGDFVNLPGDKAAPGELTFEFINSEENLFVRKQMRLWSQLIQQDRTGLRSSPTIYKTDSVFISMLNNKKEVIEKVQCIGFAILTVSDIAFGMGGSENTKTSVTASYDSPQLIL